MKDEKIDSSVVICDLATKVWLSESEASIYTTCSDTTLRRARDLNKLSFHKMKRKIIYKREDLDLWLNSLEYHSDGRVKNKNKLI